MKKWGILKMVHKLFELFAMCFCKQEFVGNADLGVDDLGIDEKLGDFESGLSAFQIVCYVPLCVVLYLMRKHPIWWELQILGSLRPWDCGCEDVEGLWFSLSNSWGSSISMECHHSLCNVNLTCWQPMNRWVFIFSDFIGVYVSRGIWNLCASCLLMLSWGMSASVWISLACCNWEKPKMISGAKESEIGEISWALETFSYWNLCYSRNSCKF